VGLYVVILVSWNVAGRRTRLEEQAARVLALEPDLVCLQEVTPVTAEAWLERLAEAGLGGALAPLPAARQGSRPLAALTASRDPLGLCRSTMSHGRSACSPCKPGLWRS
jgi:endonuclease/exonuclease/phosphatase family metal-dependent hydrolase